MHEQTTPRQPQTCAVQADPCWPQKTVLAMNICLLTQPVRDMQRWFEEQVVLHVGCSPHGGQENVSRIEQATKPKLPHTE